MRAVLSQFRDADVKLHRFNQIRSQADMLKAVEAASSRHGLILCTIVNRDLAQFLQFEAEQRELEVIDLLSPILYKFSDILGLEPKQEPGLLYEINAEYHKRVEAVNFTVKQDDGQELRYLYKADIVLSIQNLENAALHVSGAQRF